jgi:hypothetical protein
MGKCSAGIPFSRGSVAHRITGFLDFFHRPVFKKIENMTFQEMDLFPSSGKEEDTYSVGPLRKRRERDPVSETPCFLFSRIQANGKSPEIQ